MKSNFFFGNWTCCDPSNVVFGVLGDSITAQKKGYTFFLKDFLPFNKNKMGILGIGGTSTLDLPFMVPLLKERMNNNNKIDLLIISGNVGDVRLKNTEKEVKQSLDYLLSSCCNCFVVFVVFPQSLLPGSNIGEIYESVAKEKGCGIIRLDKRSKSIVNFEKKFLKDGLHANEEGSVNYANWITEALLGMMRIEEKEQREVKESIVCSTLLDVKNSLFCEENDLTQYPIPEPPPFTKRMKKCFALHKGSVYSLKVKKKSFICFFVGIGPNASILKWKCDNEKSWNFKNLKDEHCYYNRVVAVRIPNIVNSIIELEIEIIKEKSTNLKKSIIESYCFKDNKGEIYPLLPIYSISIMNIIV